MPEELVGEQAAAIYGQKPVVAPRSVVVDHGGRQFFARPGFTCNEHVAVNLGNLFDQLDELNHFLALTDQYRLIQIAFNPGLQS